MNGTTANAGTLLNLLRTLRPSPYALLYGAKPLFKCCQYCWIVEFNERKDFVEIE